MRQINPLKAGLSAGAVIGLFHFCWATLVAAGWAQPVLDFVLRLHMIEFDYAIGPFALATAASLVALTFGLGYLFGLVFALVWNWLAVPRAEAGGGGRGRRPAKA